jgi:Holliday junction resolvase RusA-like endonuclease
MRVALSGRRGSVKVSELPPKYQAQALQQLGNTSTSTTTKLKCNTGNESVGKTAAERLNRQYGFSSPVQITYRDSRRRLIDADNGWTKYFTDALVSAGVLEDDTPLQIPKRPSVSQVKSKEEGLVIIVEEI